jgi:hypothetical protein
VIALTWVAEGAASHGLDRPFDHPDDSTRPFSIDQIDEALNVSSPDPSGADQIDAEHQATDLVVGGSNPAARFTSRLLLTRSRRLKGAQTRWHCCIEPKCAGEAQQGGGSPSWKDAKKGSNHSTVP